VGVEEIPPEKRKDSRRYGFAGGQRVTEITTSKIRKFIKSRQNASLSNASINRELSSLKKMLKLAAEHEPPKVSRVIKIPMLKENNVRKGFFEHDEFLALRQVLPFYLRPVVTFAYYTGWRAGEIFGLTGDKVDLNEEVVRLNPGETKNEVPREIDLNEELMGMMKQLQARRSPGCFHVLQREGKPIRRITRAWKTACIRAGLSKPLRDGVGNFVTKKIKRKGKIVEKTIEVPTRIFHDFRRTAVRNSVRLGIPEETAMKISGHKTKAVFARYNISSKRDLKEAAQKQNQNIQEKISNGYNLVTVDLEKAILREAANA
jgi:integrase